MVKSVLANLKAFYNAANLAASLNDANIYPI
jgi:hypothetical protein